MKEKSNFLLLIFLTFINFSCENKNYQTEQDWVNAINDEENGYFQSKTINDYNIEVFYKPLDLMVLQELGGKKQTVSYKDSIKNKYKNFVYFILRYSKENKELLSTITESRDKFNMVQNTLTFGMLEKVTLTNQNNDTIQIVDYNFPRTYGLSKSTNLIFIFKRDENFIKSNEFTFNLQDIGIGIGDTKFKFKDNIIKEN